MHYIQKQILDQLRTTDTARYSDLQPPEIESSHFKYHLSQLVDDGYVQKIDRGIYALTKNGGSFVDELSRGRVVPHITPKVITYTLLRRGDTYLLWQKDKEPYRGMLNFIGGKMHKGESPHDASVRETAEKTGLSIEPLQVGVATINITESQQTYTHVVAHVFIADVASTDNISSLIAVEKATINTFKNLAPDTLPLLNLIERRAKKDFIVDLTIDCKNNFTEASARAEYASSVSKERTMSEKIGRVKEHIREVEDFPKPGIRFYEIAPLLGSSAVFADTIDMMAEDRERVTKVAGFDARGFLFGVPLAQKLDVGFVMLRKPGKLAGETERVEYDLEYGSDGLELQTGMIDDTDRVLLVDDVIATGGTALAGIELVRRTGAEVEGFAALLDLKELGGSQKIVDAGVAVRALIEVEGGAL